MGANAFEYNVRLNLNAETKLAKAQIGELQKELQSISQLKISTAGIDKLTDEIHEASNAALTLQANLQNALNPQTGNLDFTKFISSINKSGNSVEDLAESLLKVGPQGSKAFMSLADSISRAEIPLTRTNKLISGLWDNLKKTAGWQVSSSVIHGIMGQYQQAMGYAQALDKSLTDIRIVTGQSADQMARFAKEANAAAKRLSTTTTDYTNASLIYYQQGLSDAEVKKRSDITIKMANVTGTSAAKVSDQLTSIWNNFDNGTKSLEHYADVMTALGAATASSTDEIAKGIQKFAAISDTVGLSYEYAASALATITATTRESADTVGNSLKTLFSRIQGLQLGETLDDGTTLNKYSTALAKVGISIKDSSGALRDMNSILDDMGAKWHTLAEDQQMALAQTVGGVRQYTQIMTLMENWDFFKENLNTANTATGTLTMQADIYAESWEAASQRMRASMEGLWDSLIDSESFKSLLNLGSTIVDGITKAIEGLGGTTGIIHTLGGILGNVFNTQISTAISNGIHNIGAIIDPKGTKQRAVAQQQAILQQMSDTVRSSGGYIDADGLEGKTYSEVLRKQAKETVDRERHRSMMMEENYDLDAQYEAQLKEIRQNKIDSARRIDQGKKQFEAAIDSLDAFETEAGDDKPLGFISDGEWTTLQQNYQDAQDKADSKKGGKQNKAANISKAQSALLNAAAIRSGQILDENEIDFTQEIQTWADRTLSQDADFDSILSQFRMGTAKRTAEDIKRNQQGKDYTKDQLEKDLQKAVSTLLGGDSSSADQGVAKAYDIITQQITSKISSLTKKGLIDPTGKILAGHEEEVISALSGVVESVQGDTYKFNRERIASRVRSKGAKLAIDSAYQGALGEGKGRQEYEQASEDEQKKEQDRAKLESRMTNVVSATTQGIAGLASTAAGMQGIESAFKSDSLFSAAVGMGSGLANLRAGNQSYAQSMRDLGLGRRKDLLQQQKKYQKEIDDYNNAEKIIKNANAALAMTENEEDRKILEKQIEDAQKYLSKKGRKESKEKAEQYIDDITGELENYQINMEKLPKPLQKVGAWFDKVGISAEGLSAGLQAAQFAMKATAQINDYFYNENLRNAQKSQTAVNELSNAYQMSQNNYNSLLSGIEDYNTKTTKLADDNLKGAAKQAAIYDQNQSALNLIDKYNITDFTRIGDTIKINEKALEEAQEASIQSASTAKYAMGLAKVDAKEDQNEYLEEQLERDLVFDERVLQVGGVLAAGATGAAVGAAIGSVVPVVGTVIGAIVGTAVGGLAALGTDALGEGVRDGWGKGSFVDKAIEKTRETGSTSWMDDYSGDEFSASELKKLKEQRSEIKNLAASQEAAEQMDITHRESIARDLVSNNDRTEDFKYADRLVDGLANAAEGWEELGKNYDTLFTTSQQRIDAAQKINSELGLSGPVTWEDDKKNKMMTYTTADGQTGMISYDTLSRMEGTKLGKANADAYVEQMMNMYETVKAQSNEAAAAGIISYLSSGNFDNATSEEIKQAQEYIASMKNQDGSYNYLKVAQTLGLNAENEAQAQAALQQYAYDQGLKKWDSTVYNAATGEYGAYVGDTDAYLKTWDNAANWTSSIEDNLKSIEGYEAWSKGAGEKITGSMTQATKKDLYTQLSLIESTSGDVQGYLDSLTGVLEGVDPSKTGQIMQALTALDWSDWNVDDSIIEIMKEFGITIDNTNGNLENMVDIIREATNSIPNLEQEMTSLIQVMGSIADKKIGDSIDADTLQALKDQGYTNIDDYVFTTWDGKNILTQNLDTIKRDIQDEMTGTYNAYMDKVNTVEGTNLIKGLNDTDKDAKLAEIGALSQSDFENQIIQSNDNYNRQLEIFTAQVLGYDEELKLSQDILRRNWLQNKYSGYTEKDGKIYDANGNEVTNATIDSETGKGALDTYRQHMNELDTLNTTIAERYNNLMETVGAAADPTEAKQIAEQYASTFGSYAAAMNDPLVQQMVENGHLNADDVLIAIASQYDEMSDDIDAYLAARASGDDELAESIRESMEAETAMHESIANYQKITGKKISYADLEGAKEEIRAELEKEKITINGEEKTRADLYTDEELTRLAEESLIAGNAEQILQSKGSTWLSQIENMDSGIEGAHTKGLEAASNLGKYLQQYLGLTEYTIKDIGDATGDNPIIEIIQNIDKNVINMSKVLAGDAAEMAKLRVELIKQSTVGQSLTNKLRIGADGRADASYHGDESYDDNVSRMKKARAYNSMIDAETDEDFNEAAAEYGLFEAENWEEYNAAVSMTSGGTKRALKQGTITVSTTGTVNGKEVTGYNTLKTNVIDGQIMVENTSGSGPQWISHEDAGVTQENLVSAGVVDEEGNPVYTGGSGGGGGGGGGPTKVAVKSAQELMTRYKTIDAKSSIAEMQKANALTQKDLLYGEAKIAQLQKINGLLVKQQRLTADRIEEERQYLAEDKKHLQEVLDRYNKDKKDADGNVKEGEELLEFQFNSEGLITNYKQTIGVMAEELAAMYRDGELTAEEGKKAEELQKKIADLNVVIQDYEDSLNQLQTSIDTYEQTLYEMFANQAEELAYKVTYKLEMENDDLSYVKFYATALKDSMGRISDYIELTGYQVNELYDQIDVYNQGVMDLMDNAANNPMYMWATKGIEGTLTAEDITNLRTYRDGLNSVYSSLTELRKDVEEKVLKVFDEWHNKVNKNIDAISRYTDMLSQFKDIINIVGKEALGLSDAFMKTFEQQSIDQSKDNIEAAKKQYESLAEIYAEAQMNLEAARASGNEDSIKHWEEVVDKTRSEMEGAQDAMLTTLQHTLNMVAEQFTNAVTTAMDNFNESIYSYNGLDGLIADYERINEQQDLMVADYEKIYNLNKLNRQLEKTLDDTKLIAGKQKLLEFQQKINDINKSNVELSKYELEYLQAEYDLRLAEIELENARNSKDTVRLSRDSEGNWSYIYTQNESAVDEAQQKYEDALFKMQQLSQDYTKEMSASMMEITQAMRDEIAELSIQDFATPEEYYQAIQEIENRYSEQLVHREAELNKSIANSAELYNQDWQNYSDATGYKLSSAEDWTDRFSETTLGTLTGSGSYMSDYSTMIAESTNQLTGELVNAATTYFTNANSALETYGTSLQGFAGTVTSTTNQITASSKQATVDVTNMATDMVDAFSKVADEVRSWQINFGDEISDLLEDIGAKIKEINEIIKQANEMGKQNYSSTDLIGEKEAVKLLGQETFNNADLFGTWNYDEETGVTRGTYTDAKGEVKENVERNLVEFTGQLVEMIDELTGKYYEAETGSPEREAYGQELKKLFQDYLKFKNIINRIYDLTDISMPEPKLDKDKVEGLASGGYTGEWGSEGKLAFLHEKELVLNADDTANFLQALQISRQLVEMIEMNARQSSLGLGEMHASTIQDTAQTIEQQVSITAEFPNAVDHSEIEEAFDNLINMASQYAYRN